MFTQEYEIMDEKLDFSINKIDIEGLDDFEPGEKTVVYAFYNGDCIAEFVFDCVPDLDDGIAYVMLHNANVFVNKRKGVGTKIMSEVGKRYEIIVGNTVNNVPDNKEDIHYTYEGKSFIQECISKGLARDPSAEENLFD